MNFGRIDKEETRKIGHQKERRMGRGRRALIIGSRRNERGIGERERIESGAK